MKQETESFSFRSNIRKGFSRQESLDVVKCVMAFLVVVIHTSFSGYLGLGMSALARIAVPLFFMITGYYYPLMVSGGLGRHVRKILFLTIFSSLFYFLFSFIQSCIGPVTSSDWLKETFVLKKLAIWFLYNETPFAAHLWYFYALLYVFLILYIAGRFKLNTWLYKILPFLLLCNYLLSFGVIIAYRNFLFTALPYVLLGDLFRKYEKEIRDIFLNTRLLCIVLVISCIGIGIELIFYKWIGVLVYRDHYLFTLPMVVCTFVLAVRNPHFGAGSLAASIGKKYSAFIYVFHPFIIQVSTYIVKSLVGDWVLWEPLYINLRSFLIFGLTLVGVIVFDKVWYVLSIRLSRVLR